MILPSNELLFSSTFNSSKKKNEGCRLILSVNKKSQYCATLDVLKNKSKVK